MDNDLSYEKLLENLQGKRCQHLTKFPYNPLFSKNSRFNQEKTVQFSGRLRAGKIDAVQHVFRKYLPTGSPYGPKIDP